MLRCVLHANLSNRHHAVIIKVPVHLAVGLKKNLLQIEVGPEEKRMEVLILQRVTAL